MSAPTNAFIDLTNYKDRVGTRVLPGRYRVVVEDAEIDTARSGNQMFNLWFRVLNGEFEGATITDRLVNTEKSLFRIVGFLQALGFPTPKAKIPVNIGQWTGKVLDIDVEDGEPYNGRVRSEVRGYLRALDAQQPQAVEDLPDPMEVFTETQTVEVDATSDDSIPQEVDLDSLQLG